MMRFRCLAGDCEATCCGGGIIPVQESNHRRLKVLAQGDAAATELLESGIQLTPEGPAFAKIRFSASGECSMRDAAGLCKVHARFGHEALFEVCATYPRYASEVDEDVELFGTLACPEVSRLGLDGLAHAVGFLALWGRDRR
jgi:lysine-N-methylase